jgi:hypothetical protein
MVERKAGWRNNLGHQLKSEKSITRITNDTAFFL